MGVYNEYGERYVQLKVGADLELKHFKVGDKVDIRDGIYFAYEGVIAVYRGVLVCEFGLNQIYDKWGGNIYIDISDGNQIKQVLDAEK